MYLDHAATTPVRREVLEAMTPYLTTAFGNPSSSHAAGVAARDALEDARRAVARHLGMRAKDVIFTSGGTEGNNLAIKGIAIGSLLTRGRRHLVTTAIEHSSVRESVRFLERVHGFDATIVPVDDHGRVDPDEVASALREETALVSLGHANNEIGTVQSLAELAAVCRDAGVPSHIDAVQSAGWLPLTPEPSAQDRPAQTLSGPDPDASAGNRRRRAGVDAIVVSGHKIGAPKGTGAAAVRGAVPFEPLLHGGGQERGRRSGTESVAGAVALRTALDIAEREREEAALRVTAARDAFIADVLARVPGARLTGHPSARLPHIASFTIEGVNGETLLLDLERHGVVASSGSACSAGSTDPSPVLLAIGISADEARTAIRFSLPRVPADLAPVADALAAATSAHRGDRSGADR